MNLTPLFDIVMSFAGAAVTSLVPIAINFLLKTTKINLDAAHKAALETALENAVGTALSMGQSAGDKHLSNVTIRNAALSKAAGYVQAYAPEAVAYFGLTPTNIAEKLDAKVATLLHTTDTAPPADPVKAEATAAMLTKITPVSASYDPNKAMTATV
jgi:hypothetical protein